MVKPTPSTHRPTLSEFRDAARRLEGVSVRTPLLPLRHYRDSSNIFLKPEVLQPIGSYKIRGVYIWAAGLKPEERGRGIATLSAGNMAQALAYVANLFGVPARVAIVDNAPKSKIESCKKYGAEVVLVPWGKAAEYCANPPPDYTFLNPLAEFGLLDGDGSIGLEILDDAPDTDTIYVSVGAGFLSAAVALAAKAVKPSIRVIGVQSEAYPNFYESLKAGKPVVVRHDPTLADGLGAPMPSSDMLRLVGEALDEVVLTSEQDIRSAVRYLATENKLVVEGAGAITLAAALKAPKEKRGKAVCVLSGGSIEPSTLAGILV